MPADYTTLWDIFPKNLKDAATEWLNDHGCTAKPKSHNKNNSRGRTILSRVEIITNIDNIVVITSCCVCGKSVYLEE